MITFNNKAEHNFSAKQLKNILRSLTKQLGEMEKGSGTKYETREKMLDISYYNSLLFNMISWEEYMEFDYELAEIRG